MDTDVQTARLIHQRYEDTSLVIFCQAQRKLQRELAYTSINRSDTSMPEDAAAQNVGGGSGRPVFNVFRHSSHWKTAQSSICVLL